MGRPRIGREVHVRLGDELADAVIAEAAAAKVPVAEIIRRALTERYAVSSPWGWDDPPRELTEAVTAEAAAADLPVAEIVRVAVRRYIEEHVQ